MSALKELLQQYHNVNKHLGPADSQTEIGKLSEKMEKISKRNAAVFWILISMVLLLFILAIVFVGLNLGDPGKIKAILSITGISITGLIVYMNKFWKEKNYIDLILMMITTLDSDKVNAILNALILKL